MTKFHLFFVLALKAAIMILVILYSGIGLGPDEAQYWTWSQHLDWGYYSKPPGIAWQIYFGTHLFGPTELGVRFGAVIIGTLFAWAVYRLAKTAWLSEEIAVVTGCIAALTPIGISSNFLAITDGGMLLFWTLALTELIKNPPHYIRMGIWVACGALFKWPIFWLWPIVLLTLLFWPRLRSKNLLYGILISLLGLFPSVYWNISHDFATFKHVIATMQGGHEGTYARGNPLEFFGTQIALVSPIIFLLLLGAWFFVFRERDIIRFLGLSSLFMLVTCITYTFFKKGQGNWGLFAYPGAFVLVASVWRDHQKWIWIGLAASIILTAFLFTIPTLQSRSILPIPWKLNPFQHDLGWNGFKKIPFDRETQFLVGDKYQITSELSFYNSYQEPAYFFNLLGTRKNQFSYWTQPEKGKDAIFVIVEKAPELTQKLTKHKEFYLQKLSSYFYAVEEPKELVLFQSYGGDTLKSALIFRCFGFKGEMPPNPDKY